MHTSLLPMLWAYLLGVGLCVPKPFPSSSSAGIPSNLSTGNANLPFNVSSPNIQANAPYCHRMPGAFFDRYCTLLVERLSRLEEYNHVLDWSERSVGDGHLPRRYHLQDRYGRQCSLTLDAPPTVHADFSLHQEQYDFSGMDNICIIKEKLPAFLNIGPRRNVHALLGPVLSRASLGSSVGDSAVTSVFSNFNPARVRHINLGTIGDVSSER